MSIRIWLVGIASLSALAAIFAIVVPLIGTAFAVLAAVSALFLLLNGDLDARPTEQARLARESGSPGPNPKTERSPKKLVSSRPPASHPEPAREPARASARPFTFDPPSRGLPAYDRLEKLAEGAMGELWLVRHRQLGRTAALKEIRGAEVNEEDVARFTREAQVLSALRCPHTIQVYDFGVEDDGCPYYVMEHLKGVNLQVLIDKHGPFSAERAIHVLTQVCHSLEEAHQAGLVHRDVKPANIMVCHHGTEYDFAKLLDFGLVKRERHGDSISLTRPAVVLGTPAYVAPESLKGSKFVDGRADLYALGAVGFFLVTGRLLFDHDQPVAMAKAHLLEPAPRASEHTRAPLPAALDDLLYDCVRKEPESRPQTAHEVLERLKAIELSEPWSQERARQSWAKYGPLLHRSHA